MSTVTAIKSAPPSTTIVPLGLVQFVVFGGVAPFLFLQCQFRYMIVVMMGQGGIYAMIFFTMNYHPSIALDMFLINDFIFDHFLVLLDGGWAVHQVWRGVSLSNLRITDVKGRSSSSCVSFIFQASCSIFSFVL
jgi:hypothetical protein